MSAARPGHGKGAKGGGGAHMLPKLEGADRACMRKDVHAHGEHRAVPGFDLHMLVDVPNNWLTAASPSLHAHTAVGRSTRGPYGYAGGNAGKQMLMPRLHADVPSSPPRRTL